MMSLVVILKVTLIFALGSAALLPLRSASAAVRALPVRRHDGAFRSRLFHGRVSPGALNPKPSPFTVDAARAVNANLLELCRHLKRLSGLPGHWLWR